MEKRKKYYILGLSNAGKSSLINKLLKFLEIGSNTPIIHHSLHTTRDYITYKIDENSSIIDTPGICEENKEKIIEVLQAEKPEEISLIYLSDLSQNINIAERQFIQKLFNAIKKEKLSDFIYLLNKKDLLANDIKLEDRFQLGLGRGKLISTFYKKDIENIAETLKIKVNRKKIKEDDLQEKIGIFGRPNVGKSTLFNILMHGDYATISSIPHTTRDPIIKTREDKLYSDTAGITKRKQANIIKYISYKLSDQQLDFSTVAIILVDISTLDFSYIERELINRAVDKGISTIVIFNKVDLIEERLLLEYKNAVQKNSLIPSWIPTIYTSLEKKRIKNLSNKVEELIEQHNKRYTTNYLNGKIKEEINRKLSIHGLKIKFLRQEDIKPITISLFLKEKPTFSQRRYTENQLRKLLKIEVPIRLIFRNYENKNNEQR